jgi:hypothetical protein
MYRVGIDIKTSIYADIYIFIYIYTFITYDDDDDVYLDRITQHKPKTFFHM